MSWIKVYILYHIKCKSWLKLYIMLIDSLLKYNYGLYHMIIYCLKQWNYQNLVACFSIVIKSSVNVTGTKCARRRSFNLKRRIIFGAILSSATYFIYLEHVKVWESVLLCFLIGSGFLRIKSVYKVRFVILTIKTIL